MTDCGSAGGIGGHGRSIIVVNKGVDELGQEC